MLDMLPVIMLFISIGSRGNLEGQFRLSESFVSDWRLWLLRFHGENMSLVVSEGRLDDAWE